MSPISCPKHEINLLDANFGRGLCYRHIVKTSIDNMCARTNDNRHIPNSRCDSEIIRLYTILYYEEKA